MLLILIQLGAKEDLRMKSKLEIYALCVCFAAMVCLVISGGIAGYSIFEIVTPELTLRAYEYDKYQTNDAYWKSKILCSKDEKSNIKPNEEELTKQRLETFAIEISGERREGFQSLIRCVMFLLVAGITLVIHWKIAQKARAA
jgi:hypothetical protein